MSRASLYDRMLRTVGLQRVARPASPRGRFHSMQTAYQAASIDRLSQDWARALLSPDQEDRVSIRSLRARSRQLVMNNEHAQKFIRSACEQVIGTEGIGFEMGFTEDEFAGAEKFNRQVETAWRRWSESPTADQKLSWPALQTLWLGTVLTDGETFTHKVKGYPYNDSRFALQMVDADQVDINLQRLHRPDDPSAGNEIRMGVEVDVWRRNVAFHIFEGHPSEFVGVVRKVIPADLMDQAFLMRRTNQTRGVPWIASAMLKLHMLGEYDYAEVVASRWAACKMAFFVSKVGEDGYAGGEGPEGGPVEIEAQPGTLETLPEGVEPKTVDWQHPSQNYESFSLAALRGIAVGFNCSYATLTGDLRSVNFSSIRQGILSERDGWQMLQGFTVDRLCRPAFSSWLPLAILTNQIQLPRGIAVRDVCEHVLWTPRGWDWVDPNKDVQASLTAIRAGLSTHRDECAKRGKDWRKVVEQRAAELAYFEKLHVPVDLTTSGAGGVEGAVEGEDPEHGAEPTNNSGGKTKQSLAALRLP